MFLAIDIGNTKAKLGLFEGSNLIRTFSFSHNQISFDEFRKHKITASALSSVVPELSKVTAQKIENFFNVIPFIISHKVSFNLAIEYKTPETLGIDRVCGSEAAFYLASHQKDGMNYNEDSIIISADFGTATTINIVEYPNRFVGGMILPGLNLMKLSLAKNTKQLPEVDLNNHAGVIGKSTNESITSGILNATIGAVKQVIDCYKSKNDKSKFCLYLTGGSAQFITPHLGLDFIYDKNLVLKGIERIYRANS